MRVHQRIQCILYDRLELFKRYQSRVNKKYVETNDVMAFPISVECNMSQDARRLAKCSETCFTDTLAFS